MSIFEAFDDEPKTETDAEYNGAVKRVMVLMMLADGVIFDGEINAIYGVYEWVTGQSISEREVLEEIRDAEASGQSLRDYVSSLRKELDDAGKALIVRVAHGVAMADGTVCTKERVFLNEIAEALKLPREAYQAILASLDADDSWPN